MQGLELRLNTEPPQPQDEPKTTFSDDALGQMLQSQWHTWAVARRQIEEEWLKDLRAFNQVNEPDAAKISKFHSHIYIGLTRTKCLSAYSRIVDIMFQSRDKHWGIEPTPIPESELTNPDSIAFLDEMKLRAEAMEKEIEDQMIDHHYEDHVKSAILEGCILGTGVVKGVIPGVKNIEKWAFTDVEGVKTWDIVRSEIPTPKISSPSIFDIYIDPYATRYEDMSGVYERHILNRQQFSDLKNDPRFDEVKINDILNHSSDKGNYVPLYHENDRRAIANTQTTATNAVERYEVLEYWGQVSGRMLISSGIDDIDESGTYWCNVWVCNSKSLLAKIMPMKKQRIPYNFFIYNKIPHQFWGVGPARMMRHTQATLNGSIRSLLDGMAMAAIPMSEVNVHMLKEGQDPNRILPGMTFLRDSGDPSVPAVRFFQPSVPTGQLMQMAEMFKGYADDETALPAYTYGDNSNEINKTAQGMSMQMNTASLPLKAVVKNLEDFCISPLIISWFDWNMQWSDREDIKGDMTVNVLGTSALMAKETKSQQLMQFLNITANELDQKYVDRKYLLTQIAKSLEIDTQKAIPDQMPEEDMPQQEQPQISPVDQAKAQLLQVQAEKEKAEIQRIVADTANKNIQSQFSATQAAQQVVLNPHILPVADDLLISSGYQDANGYPIAQQPQQQQVIDNTPQNTHPLDPAIPKQPESPSIGINTEEHEVMM
jgi:hypothetical protein